MTNDRQTSEAVVAVRWVSRTAFVTAGASLRVWTVDVRTRELTSVTLQRHAPVGAAVRRVAASD